MKDLTYWICTDAAGYPMLDTINHTRSSSIHIATETWKNWKSLYRYGWRCIKIRFIQVKKLPDIDSDPFCAVLKFASEMK